MDFVRIGVPFTLLVMVVSVIAIPGSSRSDDSKRYGGLRAAFYCPQPLRDEKGGITPEQGIAPSQRRTQGLAVDT